MNYKLEKVFSLIKDFNKTTGQSISLFDAEFNMLISYPKKRCDFCSLIRSTSEGKRRCTECDINGMKESKKNKKLVIYRCHAGLIEVSAPIIDDGLILGYIMLGQMLYKDSFEEQCRNAEYLADDLMDDIVSLKNALQKVPQIDREYLVSSTNIMEACVLSIIYRQLIEYEKGSLWDKINRYISNNFKNNPTLEEISKELSVSVATLCKTVKKYGNTTIGRMITECKIENSKYYLENTKLSVSDISEMSGFNDYNYFSRIFKKYTGHTPSEWRKSVT